MNSINDSKLIQAGESYAAANTPLFLLRRLHTDEEVVELGVKFKADQLLDALKAAVAVEPKTPSEAVRPYALLVALWHQDKSDSLKEAAKIEAPHADWYQYISAVLLETFSPIQSSLIQLPGYLQSDVSIEQSGDIKSIILAAS